MKRLYLIILFIMFLILQCSAQEYLYILNDSCILDLYSKAEEFFQNSPVLVVKDPHGLLLRFELKEPESEIECLTTQTYENVIKIEQFLAKMNNPAIIEVHTNEISHQRCKKLKKWEISTLIANNIEAVMLKSRGRLARNKIRSVGFGEFLPPKNTSNNGGNYINRVDIMILCDVNGE